MGQDWSKNKCSQGSLFSTPPEHLFSGQYGTNLEPCGPILEPIVDFSAHLRAGNLPFCVKNKCSEGSLFSTPCEHLFSGQNRANLEPWGPFWSQLAPRRGPCVSFLALLASRGLLFVVCLGSFPFTRVSGFLGLSLFFLLVPWGPLGRPWEIICRFTLIAQAWAGRSFHHYSGHEARYTKWYQSGLDLYHEPGIP